MIGVFSFFIFSFFEIIIIAYVSVEDVLPDTQMPSPFGTQNRIFRSGAIAPPNPPSREAVAPQTPQVISRFAAASATPRYTKRYI